MNSPAGFDRLVSEHADRLGRVAYQLTGSREEALDLLQDLFVAVLRKWDKVAAARHEWAYLRRMLVNTHLNNQRRNHLTLVSADVPEGQWLDDETATDSGALWSALSDLSPRERAVLVLRYYEDLPDTEIADLLGCRRSTVRSLAARGLHALRSSVHLLDEGSRA